MKHDAFVAPHVTRLAAINRMKFPSRIYALRARHRDRVAGLPTLRTPEDDLDTACSLYLGDATAWS